MLDRINSAGGAKDHVIGRMKRVGRMLRSVWTVPVWYASNPAAAEPYRFECTLV